MLYICIQFYPSGKCKHGEQCKHAHVGPVDPTLPLPTFENKAEKKNKQGKGNTNKQTPPHQKDNKNEPSVVSQEVVGVNATSVAPRVAWGPGSTPSSIVAPKPDGI